MITGTRKAQSGASGAGGNCCNESRYGDPFIDSQNSDPIILNQQYIHCFSRSCCEQYRAQTLEQT